MSRIGYKTVEIPEGVQVTHKGEKMTVKGPKGELTEHLVPQIKMTVSGSEVNFEPTGNYNNKERALHGTMRANLNNMVEGVTNGFSKTLNLVGVGYRAQMKGDKLVLNVGYSNPVEVDVPEGLKVEVPKNTIVKISGIDKQKVGDFAAKIRAIRAPEPYKGKGIRYENEQITLKEGKTGK